MTRSTRPSRTTDSPRQSSVSWATASKEATSPGVTCTRMLSVMLPQPAVLVTASLNQVSVKGQAVGSGAWGSLTSPAGLQASS